jgi:hypothetical protein
MVMAADAGRGIEFDEQYRPGRLSSPQIFLLTMLVFLAIAAFVAAILWRQIGRAFQTNPGLNGLILGVLVVGIGLAFLQVVRLFREVRWVNSFREGLETTEPVLLAPMKSLIGRRSTMALSTVSMRSLLDSIATRLDESRDITRYLTGLLVFLGLLGTFWGLLSTVASIGDTIRTLDPGSGEARDMLEAIKSGLAAPLDGMGTAFSSSLFGLSGSLVLGFLDLQASRAQNRFYTELENWLSSVTDLGADFGAAPQSGSVDEIRNLADRLRVMQDSGAGGPRVATAMANLAEGISGLVRNMRSEQQILRDWVEAQADEQKQMRTTLDKLAATLDRAAKDS